MQPRVLVLENLQEPRGAEWPQVGRRGRHSCPGQDQPQTHQPCGSQLTHNPTKPSREAGAGGMEVGSCVLLVGVEQQWVDELN